MTSKTLLTAALAAAIGYTCTALASANIINIMPSKDNTLYEYDPAEGDHSNGAGFHFFAGENGQSEYAGACSRSMSREQFRRALRSQP